MNHKKLLTWAALLVGAYLLLTAPTRAAGFVHEGIGALASAAASLSTFVTAL